MTRIVIAAYRPKPGKVDELRALMREHVATLRSQDLVTDRESILMEAVDGTVVEVFEWCSSEAVTAAHANAPVGQLPEAAQVFSGFAPMP